ncbi:protein of unknown function [Mesotoga infera]|uniref:Uncharacterized protein n=1 Tax=Mesotoga infera TaxID=1236046 RepID=A0A7Z7PNG2_9BACT|nr:protein of unknown function [Mesotoga infera]
MYSIPVRKIFRGVFLYETLLDNLIKLDIDTVGYGIIIHELTLRPLRCP